MISINPTEPQLNKISNPNPNIYKYLFIALLFTIIGIIGTLLFTSIANKKNISIVTSTPSPTITTQPAISIPTVTPTSKISTNPTPNITITPTKEIPKQETKTYTDDLLKYSFNYPSFFELVKCGGNDIRCASIKSITLRIYPLDATTFPFSNLKTTLLSYPDQYTTPGYTDLYCSADGPTGSISCRNTKVENFVNSFGFQGYKVSRIKTKVFFPSNSTEKLNDIAYIFPLQQIIKINQQYQWGSILFSVENPTPTNLVELENIANTFKSF